MRRGNKVAAAVAAGALVILLGSGVTRCALQGGGAADPGQTGSVSAGPAEGEPGEEGASALAGTSWSSGAGDASLSFGTASLSIEGASGSLEAPYEITGEFESKNAAVLTGRLFLDGSWRDASFVLEGEEGSRRLSCDALEGSPFVEDPASGFSVSGVDPGFIELVGGDGAGLEEAVGEWARANAPEATCASFDREAYIDYASGRVTATFTCDDPSASEASVSYDGSSFSVRGVG